ANLTNAKLMGSEIGGADLRGANVSGADFADADVNSAKLLNLVGRDKALHFDQLKNADRAFID
ncbi:MAG: pentapeptide repeat-containing protein, partial [Pseudomonadota bacterium]